MDVQLVRVALVRGIWCKNNRTIQQMEEITKARKLKTKFLQSIEIDTRRLLKSTDKLFHIQRAE